ncbi:MAG: hypothetical protein ACFBRM_07500 [Pikeienuella sp.]
MITPEELGRVVEAVVRDRLNETRIVDVQLSDDLDSEGEPILVIQVVYEDDCGRLNIRRASGLIRHLLPSLAERGENRFPIISFISNRDYRSAKPEAG